MKAGLSRIIQNTVLRGWRTRLQRAAPWSRWFPDTPTVEPSRFQDRDQPFPGHWSVPPDPWETDPIRDRQRQERLREALRELPATWRAVVVARDVRARSADETADELGISPEDQLPLLHRGRAALRKTLAQEEQVARGTGRSGDSL